MALTDAMMCALATNWGLVNISLRDVTQCTQHHTISGVALYTLRKVYVSCEYAYNVKV